VAGLVTLIQELVDRFLSLLWSILIILVSSLAIATRSLECQSNHLVSMLLYAIFVLCQSLVALIGRLRANEWWWADYGRTVDGGRVMSGVHG
ncbi:hypothetical protein U1Q18_026032, partial [Sarracenia purpurea var. burkii]